MSRNYNRKTEKVSPLTEARERPESEKLKLTPEVSEINYITGIKHAELLITRLTDNFVGVYGKSILDPRMGEITTSDGGKEEILERLAFPEQDNPPINWHSLYNDKMITIGKEGHHGIVMSDYIGNKEISSYTIPKDGTEHVYFIFGKPVNRENYRNFKKEVSKMLHENYKKRKVTDAHFRELPTDIKSKVEKLRFDHETEDVLKSGQIVKAGEIQFIHSQDHFKYANRGRYSRTVEAYDLAKWKKGERVKKHVELKNTNNYLEGSVKITPNTIVICKSSEIVKGKKMQAGEDIYICE